MEILKYSHWLSLADRSLHDLSVSFDKFSDEKNLAKKFVYYDILTPNGQFGQIYLLVDRFLYMEDKDLLEEISFFDLMVAKKGRLDGRLGELFPECITAGERKWKTLSHKGLYFPPLYREHSIPLLYEGNPLVLSPEQEEIATLYASFLETAYTINPIFRDNFWCDFVTSLGEDHQIKSLDECDFRLMYEWIIKEKEVKRNISVMERRALQVQEDKHSWVFVDGVKMKAVNFKVEPPRLFTFRGEHPKMGSVQRRIWPSDITINIGKAAPIPKCLIPGEIWKEVLHENTVPWLAFWKDTIYPRKFKFASWKGSGEKGHKKYHL